MASLTSSDSNRIKEWKVAKKSLKGQKPATAAQRSARRAAKIASKTFGKFLLGTAGIALDMLVSPNDTGMDEFDIVRYYEQNGVFPEDMPTHINYEKVDSIIRARAAAHALREIGGATRSLEPLQTIKNRTAQTYTTPPAEKAGSNYGGMVR